MACYVRLFVALKESGDVYSTNEYIFDAAPTDDDYDNILIDAFGRTQLIWKKPSDFEYIIAAHNWYAENGNHTVYPITLDANAVWPEDWTL